MIAPLPDQQGSRQRQHQQKSHSEQPLACFPSAFISIRGFPIREILYF
jgi:hypothetical protein